jgi:hypothetical protein
MSTVLLPHPKDVRDLFESLLGRDVEVAPGEPVMPTEQCLAGVGLYVEDNLTLSGAVAADLRLAAFSGAALGLMPQSAAVAAISGRDVSGAMWENFSELLSVGISLLNHDDAPHVRLYGTHEPGDLPPVDVLELLRGLGRRLDLTVTISGYGTGSLSIVRTF